MIDFYFSIFALYGFIAGGFVLKKIFGKKIDTKSMTITTVYFFQPILAFWGLTKAPLDSAIFATSVLYFFVLFVAMIFLLFCTQFFVKDKKKKALFVFAGTNGNTGNMGIPLSGVLFGPVGIVAATMMNTVNVIWNTTAGVYFYARGNFSTKESIQKIFTMPLLWAAIAAIIFNTLGIEFTGKAGDFLEYGAYASIALQLYLFGLFLADIHFKKLSLLANVWVNAAKFLFLPFLGVGILLLFSSFLNIPAEIQGVFLLELMVPLAINNANLATLYGSRPKEVSEVVFTSTVLFLLFVPLLFWLF